MDPTYSPRATGNGATVFNVKVSVGATLGAGLDLDHLESFFFLTSAMAS